MNRNDHKTRTLKQILQSETSAPRDKRRFMAFTPEEIVQILTLLKGRDPKVIDRLGRPADRDKYTVEVIREVQNDIILEAVLKS